ncbi:ATP-grasp domain-containing protein [Nesterenkonia haasae]|uniref:ATP-grasp domain-containing protein n=1 Tax=Nesterenkonia haasae TaxID=2587813 RepID=UPI0013913CC3|nr:ATP-grasp domain-containing protein [Nesterenkonia haasae]
MSDYWPRHFSAGVVREAYGPRLAGYTIALEAWRRGLRVRFLDSHLRKYEISHGKRKIRFDKSRPSLTTSEAMKTEQNKHLTNSHLRKAGVPVPSSWVVNPAALDAEAQLLRHAESAGYPVVLKPLRGSMGKDVFTNLQGQEDLLDTFRYVANRTAVGGDLVLEQHFTGEDYRVLVVGNRVVAACLRKPANVTGDGQRTVQELIDAKNAIRLQNPYLCKKLIVHDREVDQYLQRHGYTLHDVPPSGAEVRLRGKANASQGGDSIDQTDSVPNAVKDAAARAVAAIPGLALAGVDILYDQNRLPVEDSFRVIEMNSRPEIELNMYPWEGFGQDVPKHFLDLFFPNSRRPKDPANQSLALNLNQLLAPLRGASAEEVLVKKRPNHAYPERLIYKHQHTEPFTSEEKSAIHLSARRAGISGQCGTQDGHAYVAICGTREQVNKFLRLSSKSLGIDRDTEQAWTRVVTQGFHFRA